MSNLRNGSKAPRSDGLESGRVQGQPRVDCGHCIAAWRTPHPWIDLDLFSKQLVVKHGAAADGG